MADDQSTNHRNVTTLEKLTYLDEDGPIAVTLLFKDSEGKPFILSMPRAVAGTIAARLIEMMQEIKKTGAPPPDVLRSPERVLGFDAGRSGDEVDIALDGDRSAFFGRISRIGAKSLAALLLGGLRARHSESDQLTFLS